jgi:hypothetical protein
VLRWNLPVAAAAPAIIVVTTALSVLTGETVRRLPLRTAVGLHPAKARHPIGGFRGRAQPAGAPAA